MVDTRRTGALELCRRTGEDDEEGLGSSSLPERFMKKELAIQKKIRPLVDSAAGKAVILLSASPRSIFVELQFD